MLKGGNDAKGPNLKKIFSENTKNFFFVRIPKVLDLE